MTTTNDRAATQVQQWPGYAPAYPPPAPPTWQPEPPRKGGGGLALVIAALTGAVVAGTVAALVTTGIRDTTPVAPAAAPMTVTVAPPAPPAPPAPAPLPAAQADNITCEQGWNGAFQFTNAAAAALKTLPPGMTVHDPAVRANPGWSAAVQSAGDYYQQASDFLRAHIAPGTTPILASAADTAVLALSTFGYAEKNFEPGARDAIDVVHASADTVAHLCDRLSP
ncbi:hypothetical protein QDT91_29620 (plasmid) [Mycolicibacterium aubagnense]|uniref:hypothetical protein n=1 Tax=Mycolicibacterium aubagnense TaxID=319707 RepID=UPI00244E338D|nr:hypothetical protein [Mycolicibacterium aubagnense]WGI36178.1 hypothetical protein QDT91_29620 [Mycolicibacterium aubagnense]